MRFAQEALLGNGLLLPELRANYPKDSSKELRDGDV